jgi:acyl-CoA thioesterase-1
MTILKNWIDRSKITLVCLLGLLPGTPAVGQMNEGETVQSAAVPQNNAMAPIVDEPGLPRVLIIGDSISIAYTLAVRDLLKGKANVHRAPVNCQGSKNVLTGIRGGRSWLGPDPWDVIHFNAGLWDAKVNWQTGLPATSHEEYRRNLEQILEILKGSGAAVIFANTTPIPDALTTKPVPGALDKRTRLFSSIPERNAEAEVVMKENSVAVDDLYQVILARQKEFQYPNDVHFNPEGSKVLAKAVADSILAKLPARKSP